MGAMAPYSIPLVDPSKLSFYIRNGYNVLFEGRHGVGKTSLVKDAFDKAGLKVLYFSAPTMDPWVDFVGVPRATERPDGSSVLEIVPPAYLADDSVDAVFFDEFNRAPKKVRNAAMELIQFHSINGRPFPRLRMVWAAINPAEGSNYDVEELDPAQVDRFQVKIDVPYRPCPSYFDVKYGVLGRAAVEWWNAQTEEVRDQVSPRRLDYAVTIYLAGGSVRDVLPPEANCARLMAMLEDGPILETLKKVLDSQDVEAARAILADTAASPDALKHIIRSPRAIAFFLPLLDQERLLSLLVTDKVLETVVRTWRSVPEFETVLKDLARTKGNAVLVARAKDMADRMKVPFLDEGNLEAKAVAKAK